ncbi:MASE1 domain-containing protein [Rhodanobacter sp. 115]|uniref:MASE1 domain-containing protein n=1 Tax=Rhodanobacter sp. FW021-MT20 TaxID=1162282 RepID=UPI000261050A|nr:MASE1 domain-containing protein [Rhodanobacter sp. 115]EIL87094.1 signal transduction histidine kinase, glucose-6-phosphate specific [Rhodanobacter sp. 115]
MYHPRMRQMTLPSFVRGPLAGLGYALLWLLLWPTAEPYWMLPFGLRFGVLLLAPLRYWPWLLGGELIATGLIDVHLHIPLGWIGFAAGDLPQPLVVAICLWLLRRTNLKASLRDPEDVSRLLLSVAFTVLAATAADAVLLALLHSSPSSNMLLDMLGQDLLGNYVGVLLMTPPLILLFRARPTRQALRALSMDGLLVMLPSLVILLALAEQAGPQREFARVLSLAPVAVFRLPAWLARCQPVDAGFQPRHGHGRPADDPCRPYGFGPSVSCGCRHRRTDAGLGHGCPAPQQRAGGRAERASGRRQPAPRSPRAPAARCRAWQPPGRGRPASAHGRRVA